MKFLQHYILALVMIKTIFSSVLCWTSMNIMNSLDQMPKIFWIGELVSIFIAITYVIYMFIHMKKSTEQIR